MSNAAFYLAIVLIASNLFWLFNAFRLMEKNWRMQDELRSIIENDKARKN